jgi:WD40 repeat protein
MTSTQTFEAHESHVVDLAFTHDSRTLISAGMDNVVKVWSAPAASGDSAWSWVKTLTGHEKSVNSLALTSDDHTLITGSSDGTVRIWGLADGEVLVTLQDRKRVVATVALSPDETWIAAGSYQGRVALWTLEGDDVVAFQGRRKRHVTSLDIVQGVTPNALVMATAGLGPDIDLWRLPEGDRIMTLACDDQAVSRIAFIAQGRLLLAVGYQSGVHVWDTAHGRLPDYHRPTPGLRRLVLSADRRQGAALYEGRVELRSLPDWKEIRTVAVDAKVLSSAALSADGRWLAVGGADGRIRTVELGA